MQNWAANGTSLTSMIRIPLADGTACMVFNGSRNAAVKISRLLLNDIDRNFWTLAYFCLVVILSDLAAELAGLRPPHSSDFGNKIVHG